MKQDDRSKPTPPTIAERAERAQRFTRICDDFERAWRNDSAIPIETLLGEAMWADLLAESVMDASRTVLPFLPPSRSKTAKVAVCDHHPSR